MVNIEYVTLALVGLPLVGMVALACWMLFSTVRAAIRDIRLAPPQADAPASAVGDFWERWYRDQTRQAIWETDAADLWVEHLWRWRADHPVESVLSLGTGLTTAPYLWADCGFRVVASDVCSAVLRQAREVTKEMGTSFAVITRDGSCRPPSQLGERRPGGSVMWLEGDFRDPAFAPGPVDVVEISRVLEHYITGHGDQFTAMEERILSAVADRVAPGGLLLVECYNDGDAGARIIHWLRRRGWVVGVPEEGVLDWPRTDPPDGGRTAIVMLPTS